MAGGSTLMEFLDRESGVGERGRRALLENPGEAPGSLLALTGDAQEFRAAHLLSALVTPGLVTEAELERYLGDQPFGLPIDVAEDPLAGPEGLLAEALGGDCPPISINAGRFV